MRPSASSAITRSSFPVSLICSLVRANRLVTLPDMLLCGVKAGPRFGLSLQYLCLNLINIRR